MKKLQFKLLSGVHDKPFFAVRNEAVPTVYLYDAISAFMGVSALEFAKTLAEIDAKEIHLRINSPGGDVFEAKAMVANMRAHGAKIIAFIDGLAASAATMVALGADEVRMSAGAQFMIHNAWTFAGGDWRDFEKVSQTLKQINDGVLQEYVQKTGKTAAEIEQWMNEETWFTAEQAVEHGFADSIEPPKEKSKDKNAKNLWDLSCYNRAPAALMQVSEDGSANIEHLRRRLRLLECCR